MSKTQKSIMIITFGGLVGLFASLIKSDIITLPEALNLLILLGLVFVTVFYAISTAVIAKSTKEQAEASVEMAKEMREQRYDTVRPIIDFEKDESPDSLIQEGLDSASVNLTRGIQCKLCNIGLGPAIDVYSNIQDTNRNRQLVYFGTLPVGKQTNVKYFSIVQKDNKDMLIVQYRDVYGRKLESSRDIYIGEEGTGFIMESLKIREIN